MKPTQAQYTILHAILSTAIATIIGAGTAATQFYFNHGQDVWLALVFFGGSLPATFVTLRYAVWHAIQTSNALPQAEKDTINETKSLAQKAIGDIENMWPFLHALNSAQKAATPAPLATGGMISFPPLTTPLTVSNAPQLTFSGMQIPPAALNIPTALPSRDGMWNDSALMPAIMPQPPRG